MKRPIIKIKEFKEAIPKKYTWYSYHEDLFVSVIRTKGAKSYVRRKCILDSKKDNSMSQWHQEWQYNLIEERYGMNQTGRKSYEILTSDKEHRIDSVVDNIAIEFQHTLSVSIDGMDTRFVCHSDDGYLPILVIDFTNYNFSQYEESIQLLSDKKCGELTKIISQDYVKLVNKKVKKWLDSKYYYDNNLFVDFKDYIVRFTNKFQRGYLKYSKDDYLNNLQDIVHNFKAVCLFENELLFNKILSVFTEIIKKKIYQSESNVKKRLIRIRNLFNEFYQSDISYYKLTNEIEDEILKLDKFDLNYFANQILKKNTLIDLISQNKKHVNFYYFFLYNPFDNPELYNKFYEVAKNDYNKRYQALDFKSKRNSELKEILISILSIKTNKVHEWNFPTMAGLLNYIFQKNKQYQHVYVSAIKQYNRLQHYIRIKSFRKKYNTFLSSKDIEFCNDLNDDILAVFPELSIKV